ncbi:hypothetical protein AUR64_06835 [Haloprofundus marisrubri]|uniref:Uncharacterized protein n=1 Tax=Haloprofundus marisrubri TaxID=1514971 RepID=A0A0W1RBW6_9EURY|nr:hypothetical protein AUR64_06835 [Haloprofundus marisrubri]
MKVKSGDCRGLVAKFRVVSVVAAKRLQRPCGDGRRRWTTATVDDGDGGRRRRWTTTSYSPTPTSFING